MAIICLEMITDDQWTKGWGKITSTVQMFSRLRNPGNRNARFYDDPANIKEVQSGYMYKSPPQTQAHFKSLKSWKRRFFVLSRTPENHYELKFFKDESRREKPMGQINLYRVTLFFQLAEYHAVWLWIQKNFQFSASCVLFMRVRQREYYLFGENSNEMDDWFNALFNAINKLPHRQLERRNERSLSEPLNFYQSQELGDQEQEDDDPVHTYVSVRQSAPVSFDALDSHYDYPRNYVLSITQPQASDDSDEDEDDVRKIDEESDPDDSCYMDMDMVRKHNQMLSNPQTNLEESNALETTRNEGTGSIDQISQIQLGSETGVPVEKDIFISQHNLKNSVIFSEKGGKVCVSKWTSTESSGMFYEGDQIHAINDLLTDSLADLKSFLGKLAKDQVKLTILRQPGSQPLSGCCTDGLPV